MGTTNLATAAGMDLTTAVDIATDALGAFNMISSDTGVLKGNLDRLSDVMAKTTNMFNTDMAQMFEAIKKGAPTFASAGQSVEDFSALIGVMASPGVKGSEAGTQLRNMMLSLANPTGEAAKMLQKLQITTKDSRGNYLNIIDIIAQFEQRTKSLGSAERAAALSTIFGSRTVTGMNILLAEGAEKLRGYRTELLNAGGAAENIANAMRGSLKNRIAVLGSAATELGFKFVEAFQEKGGNAIKSLTDWITNLDVTPIVQFASSAIDAISKFASILIGTVKFAWNFRYVIIAILAPLALYQGGLMAVAFALKFYKVWQVTAKIATFLFTLATQGQTAALATLKAGTIAYNIVSKAFAIGTKIATAAQWLFNAALTANPIGLVIVAIAALIAIIVILAKNWDRVTAAVKNNSEKVLTSISIFTGPFGFIISIVKELFDNWHRVTEAFESGGILGAIKKIGAVLLSGILAPVQGLLEILSYIPGLGGLAGKGAEKIAEFRNFLLGDDANITAKIKVPKVETPSVEPPDLSAYNQAVNGVTVPGIEAPDIGIPEIAYPDMNIPDVGASGGRSALHGVVDISGGATTPIIPSLNNGIPGTQTATSAVSTPAVVDNTPQALLSIDRTVQAITALIQNIDTTTTAILNKPAPTITADLSALRIPAQAARTPYTLPAVPQRYIETGQREREDAEREDPRRIPPVSREERMAYSLQERRETVGIEVSAAQGSQARIVRRPRSPNIQLATSGGNT
jgi:TP901 family phage tail tape measure protein